MGQKTHPIGFRLVLTKDWSSRWFAKKKSDYSRLVKEDYEIRKLLNKKLRFAAISRIFIERAGNRIRMKLVTGRPGVVIGRKGQELDKIKAQIQKLTTSEVLLDIQEIKKPDLVAALVAENVALQLERRISFRRAMKKAVQTAMSLGAEGIRVRCSGRLGGADIARKEEQSAGRAPLQTLRENVDYGTAKASTLYGIIGVKCWICADTEESK